MKYKIMHSSLVRFAQASVLNTIGLSLVAVFLPLLLLNTGLQLHEVALFYVLYAAYKLIINYPATLFINSMGASAGLALGFFSSFLFLVLLTVFLQTQSTLVLYLAPLMMALQNSLLWNSGHLHVSRAMDEARKSQDLATLANLQRAAAVISPLLGGFIAMSLGDYFLTAFASIFTIAAACWSLRIDNSSHTKEEEFKYTINSAPARDLAANVGFNISAAVGVLVWPIYLAVFIPNFQTIGVITTVAAAFGVIVLQIIGRRGDKGKSYRVLIEGTAGSSTMHFARILATSNPITITVITALYDLALDYQTNPWTSHYYSHARRRGINYIMSMEIIGDLSYVLLWSILGVTSFLWGSDIFFSVAFTVAGIAVWLTLLISKDKFHQESEVTQTGS
jgi:hypothetical protein